MDDKLSKASAGVLKQREWQQELKPDTTLNMAAIEGGFSSPGGRGEPVTLLWRVEACTCSFLRFLKVEKALICGKPANFVVHIKTVFLKMFFFLS